LHLGDFLDDYLCQGQDPDHRLDRFVFPPVRRTVVAHSGPLFSRRTRTFWLWTSETSVRAAAPRGSLRMTRSQCRGAGQEVNRPQHICLTPLIFPGRDPALWAARAYCGNPGLRPGMFFGSTLGTVARSSCRLGSGVCRRRRCGSGAGCGRVCVDLRAARAFGSRPAQ